MKKIILALAASAALTGASIAQTVQPPAAAPEPEQDATTLPAETTQPATSTDAPPSGENDPTDPEPEQDATTATDPLLLPRPGATDAAPSGEDEPSAPEPEQDATTAN